MKIVSLQPSMAPNDRLNRSVSPSRTGGVMNSGRNNMSRTWTALVLGVASVAMIGACAGNSSTGLRDATVAEILQQAWGQPSLLLNLGEVQFRRGNAYSATFAPVSEYPMYQAVAAMGLVRLERERDLTASFTGWDDWSALTQTGVQRVASVALLPEGEKLATIHPVKDSDRRFVTFVVGAYAIERVVSIEPLEINSERYSQVLGTHTFDLKSEWREAWVKGGNPDYRERRFRALLKFDPIESKWRLQATDIGPKEADFPTATVPSAIASLRSTGVR